MSHSVMHFLKYVVPTQVYPRLLQEYLDNVLMFKDISNSDCLIEEIPLISTRYSSNCSQNDWLTVPFTPLPLKQTQRESFRKQNLSLLCHMWTQILSIFVFYSHQLKQH